MERSGASSSRPSNPRSEISSPASSCSQGSSAAPARPALAAEGGAIASQGAAKIRRLIADQRYFGLGAQAFHDGAERMLTRLSAATPERKRIDVRSLGEDFRLDGAASWALLRALLAHGLLRPDGPGSYRPAARFREYALATIVAPLTRVHARDLIQGVCRRAERINAEWTRNPFRIRMIAVSGSYMSRRDQLPELSLWLLLRRRPEARMRRWGTPLGKSDALRQIVATAQALSSFILVRVVADRQEVPRPFSVVFHADEDDFDSSFPAWRRFREWGVSVSRRLGSR